MSLKMDRTILFPSPNWFLYSVMTVSNDGWVIYGAPGKSICILVPLPQNKCENKDEDEDSSNEPAYYAHVINRVHPEKIVSIAVCPEWPVKRTILVGSFDGAVKLWSINYNGTNLKVKSLLSHEVHSNDNEEVVGVGYSTEQYAITVGSSGNIVKWDINANIVKSFKKFFKNFRPVCMSCSPHDPLNVAIGTKQGVAFLIDLNDAGKLVYKVRMHDDEIVSLSWCPQYEVEVKTSITNSLSSRLDKIRKQTDEEGNSSVTLEGDPQLSDSKLSTSASSVHETEIIEEDLFDRYKDHEDNEFGHKKYQPEDILVKVEKEKTESADYLSECLKLKNDILQKKNDPDTTINSLVEAFENVDVNGKEKSVIKETDGNQPEVALQDDNSKSTRLQKHMLASISKTGSVMVCSKSGNQVAHCTLQNNPKGNKYASLSLLWYKPDQLILSDSRNHILCSNPLEIDCKHKLLWKPVHSIHKRPAYSIVSNAPRKQTESDTVDYPIWTLSQDRQLVQYSLKENKAILVNSTCGGYVYDIASCPYDANKIAVGIGDGTVRVINGNKMTAYWHNVMGKVLRVAWHPTRENLLAFSTAESRVGLIDTSSSGEKAAKVLAAEVTGAVYGLTWSPGGLVVCAGGEARILRLASKEGPGGSDAVGVELEGASWSVTEVWSGPRALLVGSEEGGVALLQPEPPHRLLCAAFAASKMIHCIDWHPQQVSTSNEESPNKNLIAACSLEHTITILEVLETEEGEIKLSVKLRLNGHRAAVARIQWSPHEEALLLSSSQDGTVRVWSAGAGACTHVCDVHGAVTLGAHWSADPAAPALVLSGGGDFAVRCWDYRRYPIEAFDETEYDARKKDKKKKAKKAKEEEKKEPKEPIDPEENVAAEIPDKYKGAKRFLFPISGRQMSTINVGAFKILLNKYLKERERNSGEKYTPEFGNETQDLEKDEEYVDVDFVKMFGSINDVNALLDMEQEGHLEHGCMEAWLMVNMFRGRVDEMLRVAAEKELMCPLLLSLAPAISFKYWKDTTQQFIAQIERKHVKGQEPFERRGYGGAAVVAAALRLATGDVRGGASALERARCWRDAFVLARARHAHSLAAALLPRWAARLRADGQLVLPALLYLAAGDLPEAAKCLGKSNDEQLLSIAADIAKASGQTTFANHIAEKNDRIRSEKETQSTDEVLKELPCKLELLLKQVEGENNGTEEEVSAVNEDSNEVPVSGEKI